MKKYIMLIVTVIATSLIFCSCGSDDSITEPGTTTLTCKITSPLDKTGFFAGDTIRVTVDAQDTDGIISEVRFLLDDNGFSSDREFPYTAKIPTNLLVVGSHTITAIAENNEGKEVESKIYFGIKPNSPTNLNITQLNVYTFSLKWSDNSTGEDGFKIERKIDAEEYKQISISKANAYIDSTIINKSYSQVSYRVRAYKEIYNSDYVLKTMAIYFPSPSSLIIKPSSIASATLTWLDNSIGEDKFTIERKISTETEYTQIAEVTGSDTPTKTYEDTSLNLTLIYDYRIRAIKGTHSSDYTIKNGYEPMPSPTGLTVSLDTDTSIKLEWTDNSKGEDGFLIDRKVSATGNWIESYAIVNSDIETFIDTNLETNTIYFYRLRAYYQSFRSNYTCELSEIPATAPAGFISIATGSFLMGHIDIYESQPVHMVNITRPYYLSKHEVTQKEWTDIMGSNPSSGYGVGDNYPVYYVSWYATLVYCNKRSISEGLTPCYTISGSTDPAVWGSVPTISNSTWDAAICNFTANGFRLPTEAEWEFAARFNDGRRYPWGEIEPSSTLCNYNLNVGSTTVVGSYPPGNNILGLCDMAGNVQEWVWDWIDTYPDTTQTDPSGPTTEHGSRGLRGGHLGRGGSILSVYRGDSSPDVKSILNGFRVARSK